MINLIFTFTILIGCQSQNDSEIYYDEDLGSYSFGGYFDETLEFKYNGDWVRIPYLVEGLSQDIEAEFGLFLFIDGLPHESRLEKIDGTIFREEAYMHDFSLSYRERYEFYVVFRPISGQIGETVMAVGTAMLRPFYMPADTNYPIFGIFHHLTSTLPIEINIARETAGGLNGNSSFDLQPLTQEILDAELEWLGERRDLTSNLRYFPRTSILPFDVDFQLYYEDRLIAENGYINFTFLTYGGEESQRRITFFIDHKPVEIDGYNYIEIEMVDGKMLIDIKSSML